MFGRLLRQTPLQRVAIRGFQSTTKKSNVLNQLLEGDSGKGLLSMKMYHYTAYASTALFPIALVLSPSMLK